MSRTTALDDLEPRIRRMLTLILRNQALIHAPKKGVLELHFNGRHVNARLVSSQTIALVDESNGDLPAGA